VVPEGEFGLAATSKEVFCKEKSGKCFNFCFDQATIDLIRFLDVLEAEAKFWLSGGNSPGRSSSVEICMVYSGKRFNFCFDQATIDIIRFLDVRVGARGQGGAQRRNLSYGCFLQRSFFVEMKILNFCITFFEVPLTF
jgi:hypothetical protein